MRIAALTHDESANAHYRALAPMHALSKRGHRVVAACVRGPRDVPTLAALSGFDVVYFWRLFYPPIWRLARTLADNGIGVVWDNDDDMTSLPKSSPAYAQYGGSRAHRTLVDIKTMMRAAHVVTAPSEALAERLAKLRGSPVVVIENHLPGVLARPHAVRQTVTVGWTASAEHRQDWDRTDLARVLQRLMADRDNVVVKSIGLRLGFRGERYEHAGGVPFTDLLHYVAHFDIGIAPLLDIPFNRSRSNVKLKEYAAAGVPWLASDVGPYRQMGEAQGGQLVSEAGWYEALDVLVSDAQLRRRLASNGARWARTQTIDANCRRWEDALQEAVELAAVAGRSQVT
jgi:hypothetical protein